MPLAAISGEPSFQHSSKSVQSGQVNGIQIQKRRTGMNIFVGSLSFKTTEEELRREFEAFGEVDTVKIIVDQETLKSRGFGFVTMPNQDQAEAAIAGMNGKQLNGFTLKVNEARPRESRGPGRERTGGAGPNRSPGYGQGGRPGGGYGDRSGSSFGGSRSGGYDRSGGGFYDNQGNSIYDSKNPGGGRRGRGGHGSGGGRSGGGRRSF